MSIDSLARPGSTACRVSDRVSSCSHQPAVMTGCSQHGPQSKHHAGALQTALAPHSVQWRLPVTPHIDCKIVLKIICWCMGMDTTYRS